MLRKNFSEQSLKRKSARISLSKKLPSDFFLPLQSAKSFPFKRHVRLTPINDENKITHSVKPAEQKSLQERKLFLDFTFYRCASNDKKREGVECVNQKSSKMQILQKFNIKLPNIVKSAQSGLQRRKKLQKVKRPSERNLSTFGIEEVASKLR